MSRSLPKRLPQMWLAENGITTAKVIWNCKHSCLHLICAPSSNVYFINKMRFRYQSISEHSFNTGSVHTVVIMSRLFSRFQSYFSFHFHPIWIVMFIQNVAILDLTTHTQTHRYQLHREKEFVPKNFIIKCKQQKRTHKINSGRMTLGWEKKSSEYLWQR